MLSIQVLEGSAALESLAPEWESLVGDSFSAVFSNPAWRLAWIEAFEPEKVTAITAREEGRLVGILPLCRIRTDSRGLYFRQVTTPGAGDYQSFVVAPESASVVLPAMLDAAISHFGRHVVYWWPNIPATDPSLEVLRAYLTSHGMPWTESTEIAPRLRLDGRDMKAVEAGLNSHHRIDVRRRKRMAAEKGPLSLWQPGSIAEAEPVLSEFFQVHDSKWLSQGFPGLFQSADQQRHFRAMLRHLWGKGLHFSTLRCGDVDISYHFGYFSGNCVQWYRPAYRTEYGIYSPGKIHVSLAIEEACRQKWNGLDFLLGEESYKFLWANETVQVVTVNAGFHEWAPSYFWFSRGKPYVRTRLAAHYAQAKAWLQRMNNPYRD